MKHAGAAPTFWTACAGCRLLHEFDRQYVGYRLMCPSCRRTFRATEVPPPPPPKKAKAERPEMTLAEMQLQLARRRAKGRRDVPEDSSTDDDDDAEEDDGPGEKDDDDDESDRSGRMAVADSDFYDFDADRTQRCFKRGQVWALYGDDDGMPRHYALLEAAAPGRTFRAQIRWLELHPGGEEGKPCGKFKVGRSMTVHSVNVFSHLVVCERVAREAYHVAPRKGSVWALHGEPDGGDSGKPKYEFVVFLSGYSQAYGASFGYLKKVQGFRAIFTRRDVGSNAVHYLRNGDVGMISHQIPARKVSDGADSSSLPPEDCWELDPAALPAESLSLQAKN